MVRAKRCCVHAYFRIKRRFKTRISNKQRFKTPIQNGVRSCLTLRPKSAFSNVVRAKRCCVHAYFRINVVSKRWFKTPKNVRLRSWLEQNADSGGSMNAKSHITTFKWRHINAFPVHLSSNNSLEQCAVHAHEIVFFSREAWTVLPWRAFWIGVLNQRFKTLILPSQNKHERSPKMCVYDRG